MSKRLNVNLDDDLHRRLKVHAALNGKTISESVIELIDKELGKDATTIVNESVAIKRENPPKKMRIKKDE